jgi:hypothetical protein
VLIGTDKFGNKFYENKDELPRAFFRLPIPACSPAH